MADHRDRLPLEVDPELLLLEKNLAQSHGDSETLLQCCQQLHRYREDLQAASLLQTAITADAAEPMLRLALAESLQKAGLPAQALRPLRELSRWPEHRLISLERQAELRVQLGQPDQAWKLYNTLIAAGFNSAIAIRRQAELAFQQHAPEQLRSAILEALMQQPGLSRELSLYTAWQHELRGESERASALYLEHLWDHPGDGKAVERLAGLMDPQNLLQSLTGQRFIDNASGSTLQKTMLAVDRGMALNWAALQDLAAILLTQEPASAEAAHWCGDLALLLGHQQQARQWATRAIERAPGDLVLLRYCLERFWISEPGPSALQQQLERLNEESSELGYSGQLLLAVLQLDSGQLEQAATTSGDLCSRYGYLCRPWVLHAEILRRRTSPQTMLQALARCPAVVQSEEIELERSIAELDLGQPREALRRLEKLHLLRATMKALNSRALCLYLLERIEACESTLRQSLRRHPHNPDAWNQLAILARERGEYWRALRYLRTALRQNPNHAPAHYNLSQLHHYNPRSRHLKELDHQLERDDLPTQDRINLLYALAKARDNCNQHDASLGLYLSASRLKLSSLENFNLQDHVQFLLNRDHAFSDYIGKQQQVVTTTTQSNNRQCPIPIFIVGLPRSGSTLAEQILSSTPTCHNLGESKLFSEALESANIPLHTPPEQELDETQLSQARDFYFSNLPSEALAAQWITDKMLYNYSYIELIRSIFPESRIIAMQRQPLDMFLSMLKCNFSEGNLWTYSLDSMLDIYDSYQKLISTASQQRPQNLTILSYEKLVQEPETTIRQLTTFLGIPWSVEFLRHQRQRKNIRTASDLRARQAIDRQSMQTWKQHAAALDPIRSKLLALGYTAG